MRLLAVLLLLLPAAAEAQDHAALAKSAYDRHILPGFTRFDASAKALSTTAATHCAPTDPDLRAAYQTAFDGWMGVQHLRFGPAEVKDRAFALAFWPDTKGRTPAGLNALLKSQDPGAIDGIASQSIAVRGFFALDYLLYDSAAPADTPYGCALIGAISGDISRIADDLLTAWNGPFGETFLSAGAPDNQVYLSPIETTLALFTSLQTGLQANADQRLGRPMGTFDAPTPLRAEARRSGRPQRNLILSQRALTDLAMILAEAASPEAAAKIEPSTKRALSLAEGLDDPLLEGAVTPSGRLHLEQDQQAIKAMSMAITQNIGTALGVAQGFNALDGDGG